MYRNVVVIGSCGAIGNAFVYELAERQETKSIYAFSRHIPSKKITKVNYLTMNYKDELSIQNAAFIASKELSIDLVVIAIGILHDSEIMPEKSLQQISSKNFQHIFFVNTILPSLIAKYFLPKMSKDKTSICVALSARVGSISDNYLGGWYSYRASKAALNMIFKNIAIEARRNRKKSIIVTLHPGTVDSHLSKPFQNYIDKDKIFTPQYSAKKLLSVIDNLTTQDSGKFLAWDGQEINP